MKDDLSEIIKKHGLKLIIIIIFCLMICLFFVQLFYWAGNKYPIITTDFEARDVLEFLGSFLAFTGTIILGAIAVYQNKASIKINDQLCELEKRRFEIDLQPFVAIIGWDAFTENTDYIINDPEELYFQISDCPFEIERVLCLSLNLKNTNNAFVAVSYVGAKVYDNNSLIGAWHYSINNKFNTKLYLNSGDSNKLNFYCSEKEMVDLRGKKVELELTLENRLGERYKEMIDIIVAFLNKGDDEDWKVYLSPQNYRVGKYQRNEKGEITLLEI